MSIQNPRARFFEAAHEILSSEGYGGLKLAAVCDRLHVTTGAFYHNFASWRDFKVALLDNWRDERTTTLAQLARTQAEPVAQLELLLDVAADLLHSTEAAIRVWARVDERVATVQEAVDQERNDVVRQVMESVVGSELAVRYANWGMGVLVGFQQLPDLGDSEDLKWQLRQILLSAVAAHERATKVA